MRVNARVGEYLFAYVCEWAHLLKRVWISSFDSDKWTFTVFFSIVAEV